MMSEYPTFALCYVVFTVGSMMKVKGHKVEVTEEDTEEEVSINLDLTARKKAGSFASCFQ